MSKNVEELIHKYLNENGKLDCNDAYKISSKTKTAIGEVGQIAKNMDIRIDNCGLGQFGKMDKSHFSNVALEKLKPLQDSENRVFCSEARAAASGVGLHKIRGTLAKNFIDVKYCELGCFTEKKGKKLSVKLDISTIDGRGNEVITSDIIEILSFVDKTASISKASVEFGLSKEDILEYIIVMQRKLCEDMVVNKDDLENMVLTSRAKQIIEDYKKMQEELSQLARSIFKDLLHRDKKR